MPIPSDLVLSHVRAYLDCSTPPLDPGRFYDSCAADALLLVGALVLPKSAIRRPDYVLQIGTLAAGVGLEALCPALPEVEVLDWRPETVGGVLRARLGDPDGGEPLTAAFCLDGEGRVRGAMLHAAPLPSLPMLLTRMQAEFAGFAPHLAHAVWPLTGLALSWLRQHRPGHERLMALPEARFTCRDRGDCCRQSWQIPVHSNARTAIEGAPWAEQQLPALRFEAWASPRLKKGKPALETALLAPGADGACTAHVGGRCTVHACVGWQPLDICQVFPYRFVATPEGICVTASYTCLTVGENQGEPLLAQVPDVRSRLAAVRHTLAELPAVIPLTPGGRALTWAAYRLLEDRLLGLLDDRTVGPMAARLAQGHARLVAVVSTLQGSDPVSPEQMAIALERPAPALPLQGSDRANRLTRMLTNGPHDQDPHQLLDGGDYSVWAHGQGLPLGAALDDELVTRYLRTTWYRKYGLDVAVTFAWGMTAWIYRVWERQTRHLALRALRPADRSMQLETARMVDRKFCHQALVAHLQSHRVYVGAFCDPRTWMSLLVP